MAYVIEPGTVDKHWDFFGTRNIEEWYLKMNIRYT